MQLGDGRAAPAGGDEDQRLLEEAEAIRSLLESTGGRLLLREIEAQVDSCQHRLISTPLNEPAFDRLQAYNLGRIQALRDLQGWLEGFALKARAIAEGESD